MVVQHNLTAMNANRMLNITTNAKAKSTEKLSSGYKINRAADDAAGLSISEKMRKQIKGLAQASSNAQDGISAVQTAEGALGEVTDMIQRMNQLAVQSANGTNATNDRTSIQDEVNQLLTEIDRVQQTTKFNETYLLNGTGSAGAASSGTGSISFNLMVGADGNDTNKINVKISQMSTTNLGISSLSVSTEANATDAVSKIATALSRVSAQRSSLGAIQNRLEHTINNLNNIVENTTQAESNIRDTDMATQMVTYSNNNILAQAGQSMLAQSNQSNQGVLTLLQG